MEIIRVFKSQTDEQRRNNLTEAVVKLENDNQSRLAQSYGVAGEIYDKRRDIY